MIALVRTYWLALTLLGLMVITVLSFWSPDQLPPAPGGDKFHHALAYMALALPAALRKPRYWVWLMLFFLGWSAAIEWLQPAFGRYGEWADLGANAIGIASALLLAKPLNRFR